MVKIRLMRMGSKHTPHYRVVVVDSRKKRSSEYIEALGYYDPLNRTDEPLKIDVERAQVWLSNGAQPTDTALKLLEKAGVTVGNVEAKQRDAYIKRVAATAAA